MEIFLFITLAILTISIISLVIRLYNSDKKLQKTISKNSILIERNENSIQKVENQNSKIKYLEKEHSNLLILKGRFDQSEKIIHELKAQLERSNNKLLNFEKENSLLQQEKTNLQKEKEEWNNKKQSILLQLSEELINKNNIQQDNFGKKQKEIIEQTVSNLNEKFSNILNKVSSLDDDVKKTFQDINFTKNALLNPTGAGRTAEITLENILKSSGLKPKNNNKDHGDFIMQSHFSDSRNNGKRPDAIVFLPKNHILIIDSKSSSHFLELQKALEDDNQESKKEIESKIKESMKRHVEDLKKRDYANAKIQDLNLKDYLDSEEKPTITTIMFLQTEKILEIIRSIDQNFEIKTLESQIQILTPAGLINLLNQAKFLIDNIKHEKNIEKLKIEIKKLMDSIVTMFKRSNEMGNAITKSLKSYNDFVGTFNSRFLPRISNMHKLGIETDRKNNIEKLKKISLGGDLIEVEILPLKENKEE